jgi:hypothetical protein
VKIVTHDTAAFHHELHVLQRIEPLKRVAIDRHQVSEFLGFDRSSHVSDPKQLGSLKGRGAERFGGWYTERF